jgi:hypothetical protein
MGVLGVTQQLSGMIGQYAHTRPGTVVLVDPFLATVDVGGTEFRAAYTRQSAPKIGDVVVLTRQNASWFIIGTTSTTGGNEVANPSFALADDNTSVPLNWTIYRQSGVSDVKVIPYAKAVEGDTALAVDGGSGASVTFVYSDPIAVLPGQIWTLSAYANGDYGSATPNTAACALRALWFSSSSALYPTTSDPDTTVQNITNIPEGDRMQLLSGNVTVPANSTTLRVGLRTALNAFTGARWDWATCRRA